MQKKWIILIAVAVFIVAFAIMYYKLSPFYQWIIQAQVLTTTFLNPLTSAVNRVIPPEYQLPTATGVAGLAGLGLKLYDNKIIKNLESSKNTEILSLEADNVNAGSTIYSLQGEVDALKQSQSTIPALNTRIATLEAQLERTTLEFKQRLSVANEGRNTAERMYTTRIDELDMLLHKVRGQAVIA